MQEVERLRPWWLCWWVRKLQTEVWRKSKKNSAWAPICLYLVRERSYCKVDEKRGGWEFDRVHWRACRLNECFNLRWGCQLPSDTWCILTRTMSSSVINPLPVDPTCQRRSATSSSREYWRSWEEHIVQLLIRRSARRGCIPLWTVGRIWLYF